jgi:tetratricopeptide (TPR) repeat protein
MKGPARSFVLLVLAILIVAGYLLAPRRNETFAIMRDQRQQLAIIALLEPRLAASEDDPYLLATLARSYAEVGEQWRAAELLERYVALRPKDAEAYGQLADLYQVIGDPERRLARLQKSVALRPQLSRALELAGLYRDAGRFADERAVLASHEADLSLDSGLLLRLAQLRAADGDLPGAIRTLMRPEVLTASASAIRPPAERFYLAELLLTAGRDAEALRWGRRWIAQWREPWRASQLLRRFVAYAPVATAAQLADAVALAHPEIRFYLAGELSKAGAHAVARRLLAGWSAANPAPQPNQIAGFVAACHDHDAPGIVWSAFASALARPAPDAVIGSFADAIIAQFGIGAIAPFWPSLPQAVVARRPLLAVRLALDANDTALARRLLAAVAPAALPAAERQQWSALLAAAAAPGERFAILRRLSETGALPAELNSEYASLALQLGHEQAYRTALAPARYATDGGP